jgi:glycosyltransferase involved in cell wall biosynthesis
MRWLGYVNDSELRTLYANAIAFIFPSLYEGFGLPPLEAMALGCPVLASNAASIPEVCGDAPLYFDPVDEHSLAALMKEVLLNQSAREDMVRRGLERLALYGWNRSADAYLSLLRDWAQ